MLAVWMKTGALSIYHKKMRFFSLTRGKEKNAKYHNFGKHTAHRLIRLLETCDFHKKFIFDWRSCKPRLRSMLLKSLNLSKETALRCIRQQQKSNLLRYYWSGWNVWEVLQPIPKKKIYYVAFNKMWLINSIQQTTKHFILSQWDAWNKNKKYGFSLHMKYFQSSWTCLVEHKAWCELFIYVSFKEK